MAEHLLTLVVVSQNNQPLTKRLLCGKDSLLTRLIVLYGEWILYLANCRLCNH